MSFETTNIILEIIVTDDEETSKVIAFYFLPTGEKLNFGFEGMWLVDFETRCNDKLPTEIGHYKMKAEWDDSSETIESIWDIEKIS